MFDKAAFDSVVWANMVHEDLSDAVTLSSTRDRPVSQNLEQTAAENVLFKWNDVSRYPVFTGVNSFQEGGTPKTAPITPGRNMNVTCNQGGLATVTDVLAAEFSRGGTVQLTIGSQTQVMQNAIDEAVEIRMLDILDDMEAMHILGDSTNPLNFDGGMTDGLVKWISTSSGHVINAGGSSSAEPATLLETVVQQMARRIVQSAPTRVPDTLLIGNELQADFNSFVGSGAQRPIVQIVKDGPNGATGLTGGQDVAYYNTGYFTVKIERSWVLSPIYFSQSQGTSGFTGPASASAIFYNKALLKQRNLIPLRAEELARTGAAWSKMIQCNWGQEHRNPYHGGIITNTKSAFAA